MRSGQFGEQLVLQGDTMVVGSSHEPGINGIQQGVVYLFMRNQGGPGAWGLTKTLKDDLLTALALFGGSVALDGDLLVIGAEGAHEHMGNAYVYSRATGNWGLAVNLAPALPQANAGFGNAVAISGDTIVVGELFRNLTVRGQVVANAIGAAWVFERNQGGISAWGRVKLLSAPNSAAFDYFGGQVTIDGDVIWVAAHGADAGGFADQGLVFHHLRDDDGLPSDRFGTALGGTGAAIVVGAPGRESGRGTAYVIESGSAPAAVSFTANLPLVMRNWYPPTGLLNDAGTLRSPSGAQ